MTGRRPGRPSRASPGSFGPGGLPNGGDVCTFSLSSGIRHRFRWKSLCRRHTFPDMSQHRLAALPLLGLLLALPAAAATYYVRTDGGPPDRCDGRSDTAAPSSGTGLPCAWDHPFRALPPGDTTRIAPGDTVVIGPGSYQMGYGAPGADTCEQPGTWDCHMPPIPSGPSPSQPTRFVGSGWDSGCPSPPELWGTERADWILDLTGSRNVEVACLVVTDHSTCVEGHSGAIPC
jgi:hypothetical protein